MAMVLQVGPSSTSAVFSVPFLSYSFEENNGQLHCSVKFSKRLNNVNLYFSPNEITYCIGNTTSILEVSNTKSFINNGKKRIHE